MTEENKVQCTYASRNNEELEQRHYDVWAAEHDRDLDESFGWVGPKVGAKSEAAGRWELLEVSDKVKILPKGEPEVEHQLWAYGVRPDGEWDGNKGLAGRYVGGPACADTIGEPCRGAEYKLGNVGGFRYGS